MTHSLATLNITTTRTPAGLAVEWYVAPTRLVLAIVLSLAFAAGAFAQPTQPAKVNLNTATAEELAYLPRIGPALADIILAARAEGWSCKGNPLEIDADGDHLVTEIYRIGTKTAELIVEHGAVCEGDTTATGPTKPSGSGTRKYGQPATDKQG